MTLNEIIGFTLLGAFAGVGASFLLVLAISWLKGRRW